MLQIGKPGKEKYIICYFLLRNLSFDFTIIIFARHDVNNLDHYQSKVKEPIANERKRRTSQPSNLVKSISSNNSNIHPAKKPKPSPKKNVRFQVPTYFLRHKVTQVKLYLPLIQSDVHIPYIFRFQLDQPFQYLC